MTKTRFSMRLRDLIANGAVEKTEKGYRYVKPFVTMKGETGDALRVCYNKRGFICAVEGKIVRKGKGFSLEKKKRQVGKTTYFRRNPRSTARVRQKGKN